MAYLDNPGPLDGGEVGDGTGFYQLGSYSKLSPRGNSYRRSCRCSFSWSGGRRDTGMPGLDDPTSGGITMVLVFISLDLLIHVLVQGFEVLHLQ